MIREAGLTVLARNFSCRQGEIDLVARDGSETVFIEVRARSRSTHGSAAESVTARKRQRLIRAARFWIARHGETPCRFDVVAVDGARRPDWIRNAFAADGSY